MTAPTVSGSLAGPPAPHTVSIRIPLLLCLASVLGGCASSVAPAEDAVLAYVDALERGDCQRAARSLSRRADVEGWAASCEEHLTLYQRQATAIRESLRAESPQVTARLRVDRLRSVRLEHRDGAWFVAEPVALLDGAETPVASMAALAAALESDAVVQILSLLGEDLRAQYVAEIGALSDALVSGGAADMYVYGDTASVELGGVTIRLAREGGSWRVTSVEQAGVYDQMYYDEW